MSGRWLPQESIRRKRAGERLDREELVAVAAGLADGTLSDAQAAAFAMAVCFRGMHPDECAELTWAMRDSGDVLDWSEADLPGPVLDKHSTGGVGDLVSLPLGPMIAACGGFVPMISGRGLGHTGGTLDKLGAIPGYHAWPSPETFRKVVREAGVAIVGASHRVAPADRRLYAIRDVTATVDCLPLITASILSKKLAAGLDALALDVKTGNGAVMTDLDDSRRLAGSLVRVAAAAGLPVTALVTDMSEPLARSAGNALELREAIGLLKGEAADARLVEVTLALGGSLLCLGGLDRDERTARGRLRSALASGAAAERFARMVAGLGGPADLLERADHYLPPAPVVLDVPARRDGWVGAIDTRALGMVVVTLGGGRTDPGQDIDPRVGLDRLLRRGQFVRAGEPLARVHAADEASAREAIALVQAAFDLMEAAPQPAGGVVIERMDAPARRV
jgi:thymidine phosphorylase